MPVRPHRPPLRRNIPFAYHAGATARDFTNKAGRRVVAQSSEKAVDYITQGLNTAIEAAGHFFMVTLALGMVTVILMFHLVGQVQNLPFLDLAFRALGIPTQVLSWTGGGDPSKDSDLSDLGEKVKLGQVFNRYDGGTVAVNSGWGPRDTGIPGASRFHRGIDLPLEGGYPLFAWTKTEVVCSSNAGHGNLATLKLGNGQVYRSAHLSSCTSGGYHAGQTYGGVGTTGVSSGNHLHWEQKNSLGQLVHPQTNPLQATLTGKWPGGGASSTGGVDIDFIKKLEGGFHKTAYLDGHENGRTRWSWGYGTKAPGPGQTISQEKAHQELVNYLSTHCLPIIPNSLPAHRKTAAASLCYNAGPGVKNWAIWRDIEANGNPRFTSYTRATTGDSLLNRRTAEQNMWDGK